MSEDDTKDVLRDLGARLFALQAGLMAVIRTHPNPQALSEALDLTQEPPKAVMLGLARFGSGQVRQDFGAATRSNSA